MVNNYFSKVIHPLKNMTIRKKLLISYFVLIFLPLVLLTIVSYKNVSKVYQQQVLYSAEQSFDQAYTFLSYKLNTMIKSSDVIFSNSDVQEILSKYNNKYKEDIIQQNIDRLKLENFFSTFLNTEDIYRVNLFVPGWLSYSEQDIYFSNIDTFSGTDIYEKFMASKEKVFWMPTHKIKNNISGLEQVSVISLLRKIRNSDQINEIIGVIKLSIPSSTIQEIIYKANITQEGVVYIQNSNGAIISYSNKEKLNRFDLNNNISKELRGVNLLWENISIGNENFAITARVINNTDWTMISAVPYSEINAQSNRIKNIMLILMFFTGFFAYGIANVISISSIKRITLLMKNIKSVQEGNLDVEIISHNKDEIGKLTNSFNYMVKEIRLLVKEQYKNGKEIKNLELKALQAQINPHFLYNTLETINWKAIDNDVPEIAVITQSLAKYYKLSLKKGEDIVSIEDEINHIKTYVQIQNLRFDNRINLSIDIDSELYRCNILKLILQPIVENSIIHGILENSDSQSGSINIIGHLDNDNIILNIQDNGVGMTEKKMSEILTSESTNEPHSYGVRNVNNRIKLCYGQQYGLTYHSILEKGTQVEIMIPANKKEA